MQLRNKKELAAKVLKVGKGRIVFVAGHESEIKEAITRRDVVDLYRGGAIQIKEVKGRKKIIRRKHRRGIGKVKKKVKTRKQDYVKLTRKLRTFAKHLLKTKEIENDKYKTIRKMIKAKRFRSKRHLNDSVKEI